MSIQEFMTEHSIIEMIYPKVVGIKMYPDSILNNPNIFILVIRNMAIGIVMVRSIAERFGFIRKMIQYNEEERFRNYAVNIIVIYEQWDTSNWYYTRVARFYEYLDFIEDKTVEYMISKESTATKAYRVDTNFLLSLLWNNELEME